MRANGRQTNSTEVRRDNIELLALGIRMGALTMENTIGPRAECICEL